MKSYDIFAKRPPSASVELSEMATERKSLATTVSPHSCGSNFSFVGHIHVIAASAQIPLLVGSVHNPAVICVRVC